MEEKLRVMVVDDNKEFVKLLTLFVDSQTDMQLVGSLNTGENVINKIKQWNPSVLLLDMVMPKKDGLQVLKELNKTEEIEKLPYIVVMSLIGQEKITHKAIELGAMYYVVKPFDIQTLVERLRDIINPNKSNIYEAKETRYIMINKGLSKEPIDYKVTNMIHDLGVPAHIKGYKYLREAIILAVENTDVLEAITKTLYPLLSKTFKTTPSRVERAIRHAIEVAWNRGDTLCQVRIFGYSLNSNKGKPTNSEFIALIADKIILEAKTKENNI